MSLVLNKRYKGFSCGSAGKESACNVGDLGSIPGLGRSPGEGKGYPLQNPGLENSMDSIVQGVTKIQIDWVTFTFIECHFSKNVKIKTTQIAAKETETQKITFWGGPIYLGKQLVCNWHSNQNYRNNYISSIFLSIPDSPKIWYFCPW